ncbi:MAG: tRNA glutamyl-Q(34) synthetase GluQRS [Methylotenera sp.]|jgi:glutamyl-Q tRNA(Asp) synthetase|nr:tRNA glutamyl-Q(34) synthetase GluQRS [Methylotenera sp.]
MVIGRFAPSPTGPLHFGSLVAAVASYLEVKTHQGRWLLRMEDLDKPREIKGAADTILHSLEKFGFEWDGDVLYQSQRHGLYEEAFNSLKNKQLIYPCTCTRKEIADTTNQFGIDGIIYPGTCLSHPLKPNEANAWRVKTNALEISFVDAIQGEIKQTLSQNVGDFILKRADGLFAYQLAVVVDDAAQDITHIVRGADLLDSTPRQIYLQQLLGFSTPHYAHVPVATNAAGEKLSKQTLAKPITEDDANHLIFEALSFLGQYPSADLKHASLNEIWHWATNHWDIKKIPRLRSTSVKPINW